MAKTMETISTINSTLRTVLALLVATVLGIASYFGYNVYHEKELALKAAQTKVSALEEEVTQKQAEIEKLEVRLKLLKVDHRIGRFHVVDQTVDPDTGDKNSKIRFQEIDRDGQPVGQPREYVVKGDVVYVEYWVVKFEDKYVEEADPFRNTSIFLFRKIFGEDQKPSEVPDIDVIGDRPMVYGRSPEATEFENQLWKDFWKLANDPEAAKAKGIRAIHGETPNIKMIEGKTYELDLRSSGGVNLKPIEIPVKPES
ncbi:hypothetical protein LOC68_14140 [Blastopirellula sp. JC732]|uniref:Uncharacterized protein n=1 Tax=Blastopirellula sediminis TaxID=2894196 RepID=A0A9X1SFT2_9BACT|nr:hypothetical protein [Blastopirellula sediminis]MCC9607177.1 hypothetical protein [Blastopirellula sediminis]MCC9629530.1 hypothetical protein [Blastopirellula sediminis]